jgi:hypothetical protein
MAPSSSITASLIGGDIAVSAFESVLAFCANFRRLDEFLSKRRDPRESKHVWEVSGRDRARTTRRLSKQLRQLKTETQL